MSSFIDKYSSSKNDIRIWPWKSYYRWSGIYDIDCPVGTSSVSIGINIEVREDICSECIEIEDSTIVTRDFSSSIKVIYPSCSRITKWFSIFYIQNHFTWDGYYWRSNIRFDNIDNTIDTSCISSHVDIYIAYQITSGIIHVQSSTIIIRNHPTSIDIIGPISSFIEKHPAR